MRTKIAKNVKRKESDAGPTGFQRLMKRKRGGRKKPVEGMLEKRFGGWNTHERTDIDKDKDFKWTDAGGALMGYTKDQVEQQRKHNKKRNQGR